MGASQRPEVTPATTTGAIPSSLCFRDILQRPQRSLSLHLCSAVVCGARSNMTAAPTLPTTSAELPALSTAPVVDETTRAQELVAQDLNRNYEQTSHLFTLLMLVQWVAGIAAALWIAPYT